MINTQRSESANPLTIINGKKFTRREIDIIACLVCGRAATIPLFLSIATRTVETHVHNIMLKIECNSRESIIDFIEHSDKRLLIKAHYESLVSDILFEKSLKSIGELTKKDFVQCTLWYESNAPHILMEIINKLIKHMKLLGIGVALKNKKDAEGGKNDGIIPS